MKKIKVKENNAMIKKVLEKSLSIEEFVKSEDNSVKTKKWVQLFERYFNSQNVEKRDKLYQKVQKTRKKLLLKQ